MCAGTPVHYEHTVRNECAAPTSLNQMQKRRTGWSRYRYPGGQGHCARGAHTGLTDLFKCDSTSTRSKGRALQVLTRG